MRKDNKVNKANKDHILKKPKTMKKNKTKSFMKHETRILIEEAYFYDN